MKHSVPLKPTTMLINEYVAKFNVDAETEASEAALAQLVQAFPRNEKLEHVLLKVVAINALYNTSIYATYPVAAHILQLDIDARLADRDVQLVGDIANVKFGDKKRRFYSFATKYCSWHAADAYPIYDSYVEQLLWDYVQAHDFINIRRDELQDFPRFKATIEAFRDSFGLSQFGFKEIDKFLWFYGTEWDKQKRDNRNSQAAAGS
jgi:hypothetical protein